MRTWKQGVVGVIKLSDSESIYVHCHKYPCALLYRDYNPNSNTLESFIFGVMIEKEVLKNISRIGSIKLSKEDKMKNEGFVYHSRENIVEILNNMEDKIFCSEKLYTIKEIEEMYYEEKNTKSE